MSLEFEPKNHIYKLDGRELPSVSEITRFISRELYKEADQTSLDIAADRGTRVHRACEEIDRTGLAECDTDIMQYLSAYVKFLTEHDVKWEMIEQPVYSRLHWVAGTVDRLGLVDGKMTLLDIKTAKRISGQHKLQYSAQLTLYREMVDKAEAELCLLQLKDDCSYKLIDIEPNWHAVWACESLHHEFEMTKQKSKRRLKPNG